MRTNPQHPSVFTEAPRAGVAQSGAMVAAERMSAVDRAWLLMERPTNPMTIVAVIVLGGRITRARIRALVEERFAAFHRFRCRPVANGLAASWVEADPFDLDDHILGAALPSPAGQAELEALVGELAGTPFNSSRPWWTFHVVEHYGHGSAIIARIHHCYADGIALIRVLLGMADGEHVPAMPPPQAQDTELASDGAFSLGSLYAPVASLIANTLREGAGLVEQTARFGLDPKKVLDTAMGTAGLLGEIAHLGTLADDPPTPLKRPLSGSRRVAWAAPLAFEEVRTIGHVLGCTVNDVLVATLAGALGRYLEGEGERTEGLTLHAAVPINLRQENEPSAALGNRFGLVFVELPVGIRHPLERLYAVHAAMKALKGSSEALVTFGLLAAVGALPPAVEQTAIETFTAKASLVASNVPGPPGEIRIAGVPVKQMLFWVPQAGSIGTGISMLSYNGQVQFGVMSDRRLIPEPRKLVALVETEFERLVLLVLLGGAALQE
jgi:diacylglycerol O-acyltransferase